MKLILTRDQGELVLEALEWAENPDYPDYDSNNARLIRIENKIRKALGKEEYIPRTAEDDKKIKEIMDDWTLTSVERAEKLRVFEKERVCNK